MQRDISVEDAGGALENVSMNGHAELVKLILELHPDIAPANLNDALETAAGGGRLAVVRALLACRSCKEVVRSILSGNLQNQQVIDLLQEYLNDPEQGPSTKDIYTLN